MTSYPHKTILFFIFSCALLASLNVNAGECRGLYVKDSKSSGMIVKKNNCLDSPHLSEGSVIELAPKGRLWLKSIASHETSTRFQLICQNRSNQLLQLEFSDNASPWLNLSKLNGCHNWTDNKLNCKGKKENELTLYCVLPPVPEKTAANAVTIERGTSVKMRSFDDAKPSINFDEKKMLVIVNAELQVCKQLNQTTQALAISWIVDIESKISVDWGDVTINSGLSSCTKAVVTTFPYPKFSKTMVFNTTF